METSSTLISRPWVGLEELWQIIVQALPERGKDLRDEQVRQLYPAVNLVRPLLLALRVHDVFVPPAAACSLRSAVRLAGLCGPCNWRRRRRADERQRAPTGAGAFVFMVRPIGVIEADRREKDGTWVKNDRPVAVATHARTHHHVHALDDLRPGLLDEIEAFAHYNQLSGKKFKPADRGGPERTHELINGAVTA